MASLQAVGILEHRRGITERLMDVLIVELRIVLSELRTVGIGVQNTQNAADGQARALNAGLAVEDMRIADDTVEGFHGAAPGTLTLKILPIGFGSGHLSDRA